MDIPMPLLRKYLGGVDPSEDYLLEELLARALGDVQSMLGRTFGEPDEVVEYLDGNRERRLELRNAVASGAPAVAVLTYGAWTDVQSSLYFVDVHPQLGIANVLAFNQLVWPYGCRNVRVTYTAGYTAGQEPAAVRGLVMDLVGLRYRTRVTAAPADNEAQGTAGIPEHLQAVIDEWRFPMASEQPLLVRGY